MRLIGAQKEIVILCSLVALSVAVLTLGSLLAVFLKSDSSFALGENDIRIIKFTIWQAFLSALVSCLLAIPVARAFARRNFIFKNMILSFLGAPFILPVIIAVISFIMIFGNSGLINKFLIILGFPKISVYGLHGIVLVNAFFNMPLAIRLILNGWLSIPAERFRLSAQLNLSGWAFFRLVELPMLKIVFPGIFMVIFVICLSSFVVALSLGGGPKSTTIELAIFQAFRLDFDLGRACFLALIQFGICSLAILFSNALPSPKPFAPTLDSIVKRWDNVTLGSKVTDFTSILVTMLFVSLPIIAILAMGIIRLPQISSQIWEPTAISIGMALFSSLTATISAFCLGYATVKFRVFFQQSYEFIGYFSISFSPLLLGTGLFILILPFSNPNEVALGIITIVNALMAMPFVMRILLPPLRQVIDDFGKLSQNLGLSDWQFIKLVIVPKLSQPIGFSLGLSAAISVGDFGVIALFSLSDKATLPMALYSLMGAYRMEEAAAVAVILLMVTFGLFFISDLGGRYFAKSD